MNGWKGQQDEMTPEVEQFISLHLGELAEEAFNSAIGNGRKHDGKIVQLERMIYPEGNANPMAVEKFIAVICLATVSMTSMAIRAAPET